MFYAVLTFTNTWLTLFQKKWKSSFLYTHCNPSILGYKLLLQPICQYICCNNILYMGRRESTFFVYIKNIFYAHLIFFPTSMINFYYNYLFRICVKYFSNSRFLFSRGILCFENMNKNKQSYLHAFLLLSKTCTLLKSALYWYRVAAHLAHVQGDAGQDVFKNMFKNVFSKNAGHVFEKCSMCRNKISTFI